ncbi:MAG: type I glyceraldehyde-3-phosphate dehydrogenase, partial [Gammaproteobacteria bacterium]|nr:type I glyceraldehyde-3-phosphate dehydrogenase [Gammaproteobacteria bacterium]
MRVGINGLGRIGRLALRIAANDHEFEFVKSNDPGGDAALFAHLLQFDSTHGKYPEDIIAADAEIQMGRHRIQHQTQRAIADTDWSGVDLVIEASGKFKALDQLQPYFDQGVQRVLLTAPSKDPAALNLVYGVNHHLYDAAQHCLVTAASCTTNCIAPVVKVIHGEFGIEHGSITTIHDITNTQSILDAPHKDLRR